jgi:hypothetical protein
MSFSRISRRQFAGMAAWSALGISTQPADSRQADESKESRLPNRSLFSSFPSDFLWGASHEIERREEMRQTPYGRNIGRGRLNEHQIEYC